MELQTPAPAPAPTSSPELISAVPMSNISYSFRKQKIKEKLEDGTVKETEFQRPTFECAIPLVTQESLTALLKDAEKSSKSWGFVLELVNKQVYEAGRAQVYELIDNNIELSQDKLNMAALDLWTIITTPRATNTGIPKPVWESFTEYYVKTVVEKSIQSLKGAKTMMQVMVIERFSKAKGNKPLLEGIRTKLEEFITLIPEEKATEYSDIFVWADEKITELLALEDDTLAGIID